MSSFSCITIVVVPSSHQIAHMRHFEDPLTMFVRGFDSGAQLREAATRLSQTASFPTIDRLLVRIWGESGSEGRGNLTPEYLKDVDWNDLSIEALLSILDCAHRGFRRQASRMRMGYQVIRIAQKWMRIQGYRVSPSTTGQEDSDLTFMSRVMRGRVGRDMKHLAMLIK